MIYDVITNKIAISCFFAVVISQLIKFILHLIKKKEFNIDVLIHGYGGMPSTHTAVTIALAYSIFLTEGATTLFVFSLVFAFITMNDVLDIRWFFNLRTKVINDIIKAIKKDSMNLKFIENFFGHTTFQVFAGAILGVIIVLIVF